jgi:hypothetical protein
LSKIGTNNSSDQFIQFILSSFKLIQFSSVRYKSISSVKLVIVQSVQLSLVQYERRYNEFHSERTKHVEVKWNFINDAIKRDDILVKYISSEEQQADIFTKALQREQFIKLRDNLMYSEQA